MMRREPGQASHRLRDPLSLSLGAVRDAERAETGGYADCPAERRGSAAAVSPSPDRFAVEIPEKERRAGVNPSLRLWIILDEYNRDVYRPIVLS
jgi:hypothetical protein